MLLLDFVELESRVREYKSTCELPQIVDMSVLSNCLTWNFCTLLYYNIYLGHNVSSRLVLWH